LTTKNFLGYNLLSFEINTTNATTISVHTYNGTSDEGIPFGSVLGSTEMAYALLHAKVEVYDRTNTVTLPHNIAAYEGYAFVQWTGTTLTILNSIGGTKLALNAIYESDSAYSCTFVVSANDELLITASTSGTVTDHLEMFVSVEGVVRLVPGV